MYLHTVSMYDTTETVDIRLMNLHTLRSKEAICRNTVYMMAQVESPLRRIMASDSLYTGRRTLLDNGTGVFE